MYLIKEKWSEREVLAISLMVSLVPWVFLLGIIHLLGQNRLALEVGLVASGFLALLFAALLSLTLFVLKSKIEISNFAFLLRKVLLLALLVSPALLLLTAFLPGPFPLNLALILLIQGVLLYHRLPSWRQRLDEETVRLEPVFFLIVGLKVTVFALLLAYAFRLS